MPNHESFVTIVRGADTPCVVWNGTGRVLGYYTGVELPVAYDALPWWVIETDTSLGRLNSANRGRYPVLDREACLLWPQARIEMRFGPTCNAQTVTGQYVSTSEHGIVTVRTDEPVAGIGHRPIIGPISLPPTNRHDLTASEFKRDGALPGWLRLARTIGNHDRGFDEHYVRLIDDPRTVSRPAKPRERRALTGR